MEENVSKCIKRVGNPYCPSCRNVSIKYGKSRSGKQRYRCKVCSKFFVETYCYQAYLLGVKTWIIKLTKEGMGIRSISRLLSISCNTVQSWISHLSTSVKTPGNSLNKSYEVDELCTYIGNKSNRTWIAYAYCRESRSVVDFVIGTRSKMTLQPMIDRLLGLSPKTVYTDKHQTYATLIPKNIHSTACRGTNHIERMNLTLRTHLKRLSRRRICFSRSIAMLEACLMIYFFG